MFLTPKTIKARYLFDNELFYYTYYLFFLFFFTLYLNNKVSIIITTAIITYIAVFPDSSGAFEICAE